MVRHNPHGHIHLFIPGIVGLTTTLFNSLNQRAEDIRIVIAGGHGDSSANSFKAHAGIDMLGRQSLQFAVSHALKFHKYQVP